jgi:hypothetical protein
MTCAGYAIVNLWLQWAGLIASLDSKDENKIFMGKHRGRW